MNGPCDFPGCCNRRVYFGLCGGHENQRKHGRQLAPLRFVGPLSHAQVVERFWLRVAKGTGCWTWTGKARVRGYGQVWVMGRHVLAHKFSWELVNGPVPKGRELCHECDNPPCVRPDHLFLGTHAENMQDAKAKDRLMRGEDHPHAKLNDALVRQIRQRWADGDASQSEMARELGISSPIISRLVRGLLWTHVK